MEQIMGECQSCRQQTKGDRTLCLRCHVRLERLLLRLASDVTPMRDSLDATLHPGGHQPNRIRPSVPPTPIRLDVLDLMDVLDATAYQLWHILDGTEQTREQDLRATLIRCARHPRLARFHDAGLYMDTLTRLGKRIDEVLDPPERQPIGDCTNPLCGVALTAGSRDQWVTCPVCGMEQRTHAVKLAWLARLCDDPTKTGSASEVAKVFATCGVSLNRNTINQWAKRGKLQACENGGYRYGDVWRLAELEKI